MIRLQDDRIKLEDTFRAKLFGSVLARHNMTLLGLSKRLGCGYSAVKNWNSGKNLLPKGTLDKMLVLSG